MASIQLSIGIGKTVLAAYHLNNKDAKRELDVFVDNKRLVCQQAPKYPGVRLDRMLNFKQHLEEVAGKVTSRVALIRRLAGTTWGGEPLLKQNGSPRKAWYSPQLNSLPCLEQKPTCEEGSRRNQQLSAVHIWLSQADTCVTAPCLSRDSHCRPKATCISCPTRQRMTCLHADSSPEKLTKRRLRRC